MKYINSIRRYKYSMKEKPHIIMTAILAVSVIMAVTMLIRLEDSKNRSTQAELLDIPKSNLAYSFDYEVNPVVDNSDYNYKEFNKYRRDKKEAETKITIPGDKLDKHKRIIEVASSYLEVPYVWGGTNPRTGLDCSGFTQLVYRQMGYKIPRVSKDQSRVGEIVVASKLQVGDLLFFDTLSENGANITIKNIDLKNYFESENYRPKAVSHVGIYIGDGMMIHAASGDGKVVISDLSENYYRKRFLHARRIL